MTKQGMNLTDYIKVYQTLTPEWCQKIITATNKLPWHEHQWHNSYRNFTVDQKDTEKKKSRFHGRILPHSGQKEQPALMKSSQIFFIIILQLAPEQRA